MRRRLGTGAAGARQSDMLSFALYFIGSVACIAGLAWIATLLGAANVYVTAAAAFLLGLALLGALAHKREAEAG